MFLLLAHCLPQSLFFLPLGVAFGIKSHLGKSQTAATKPNATGGRLITQLINPADVIVSAHFFVIWMRTSYVVEIGFEPVAKCLLFFFFSLTSRASIFSVRPFYALVTHF